MIRELNTYDDGAMVSLVKDRNTVRMTCTCSRFRIREQCQHIIKTMAGRYDAPYKAPGEGYRNLVPIFMKKDIRLTVPFEIDITRKGAIGEALYEVYAVVHDRPEYFLGYLSDHDGRVDIRTMFLEWLTGQVDQAYRIGGAERHYCKSPHHEGNADFLSGFGEADSGTMGHYLVDYWYFMTTGVCAACADISTVPI